MLVEALLIQLRINGVKDDHNVAFVLNNVALDYVLRKKFDEAESRVGPTDFGFAQGQRKHGEMVETR